MLKTSVCFIAGDRRETPNIMACSKGPYGICTRCGTHHRERVGPKSRREVVRYAEKARTYWDKEKAARSGQRRLELGYTAKAS